MWTPGYEQAGDYVLKFGVADPSGLTDSLTTNIHIDNVDRAPALQVTDHGVVVGQPFSLQLVATDPDLNTTLAYAANGLPPGAALDPNTGLLTWTPGPTQTGDYAVQFSVSDGELSVSHVATLRATLNPVSPQVVIELTPSFPGVPESPVIVHVAASSMAPIEGLTLSVNGQALTLDSHGRATYVPQSPGLFSVVATATDGDGLTGTATTLLKVRDPNDQTAPSSSLDNLPNHTLLTAAMDVQATVSDSNLDSWVLEQALVGSSDFTTLASGNATVSGTIYHFDPAALRNGAYELRLTATDISGRSTVAQTIVEADTAAKPSAYVQNFTDLSVVLGGTTVNLVRSYASIDQDVSGSFGYGWRLANIDTDIQSSIPLTGRENLGTYNPFVDGTRVYLTLPDGQRVGFTFTPEKHVQSGVTYYTPEFVADPGVDYRLDAASVLLSKGPNGYYELQTARPYNPASGAFGGADYTLTAADGTVYDLSTARGVLDETTPNGNKLYFSDGGIVSSNGDSVQFVKDAAGRLTSIIASDGTRVIYSYDSAGNLVSVHNTDTGDSARYGYAVDDPHLLTVVTSPRGQPGNVINYGSTAQSALLSANLGGAGDFGANVYQGSLAAGKTDYLAFNLRPSELESTASGDVLLGVQVTAANGSALQPGVPIIAGLTPLLQRSGNGTSFALFAVSREGLEQIRIAGSDATTAGDYSVQLFVVGDVNQNGVVDGNDSALLNQALGSSVGQPGYIAGADANRDGVVNAADAQLLGNNYGFVAAPPPVAQDKELLTHIDLPLSLDLDSIASDPEGDPLFYKLRDR
ncbi:MAG: putative Ig domain-containing protein [Bradyrhizobium sp.]